MHFVLIEVSLSSDHTTAVFIAELILLLFFGRAVGELMSRLGQPAIFGQLIAGILLGPSVFGALMPAAHKLIFPGTAPAQDMLRAIAEVGILLLLLLTGMETNLGLVMRQRATVAWTSLLGIALPFAVGTAAGFLLPDALFPGQTSRLAAALFLGTALSISSVKIVAMVLMEVGAIRRDLGQLILATAILDDTIAWILIALISGLVAKGGLSFLHLGATLIGCFIFLVICLTAGRRLVAEAIRWTNDNLTV
ncbi:MAG: cation:proton antiporter, partial [Proteobacteria bacterium]|nr:cation:proton antiporter [Pseudomonadota bacterium]